jgi:diguanylate cyclase (GGDEF)-like protein
MSAEQSLLFFDCGRNQPPDLLRKFCDDHGLELVAVPTPEGILQRVNRGFPASVILDGRGDPEPALELLSTIKSDAFTSIVPLALIVADEPPGLSTRGLEAGADEVLSDRAPDRERYLRLELMLRRAARDVSVHPTTRLPGTTQIERDLAHRLSAGEGFALCYADLDHFKEFNDRYGYNRGDRVILLLSKILRDLVRALAPGGFVGHIGGDDFLFTVPIEYMETVCDEILELFDELIPYQYSEEDRRAGYFLGKDRRGSIHRIPLMTLSIGIVTNQFQEFVHTGQVSERAGEMKTYAKTLPGSIYVVDRRTDRDENGPPGQEPRRESDFSEPDVPVPFPTGDPAGRSGNDGNGRDAGDRRDASNVRPAWASEQVTPNHGKLS